MVALRQCTKLLQFKCLIQKEVTKLHLSIQLRPQLEELKRVLVRSETWKNFNSGLNSLGHPQSDFLPHKNGDTWQVLCYPFFVNQRATDSCMVGIPQQVNLGCTTSLKLSTLNTKINTNLKSEQVICKVLTKGIYQHYETLHIVIFAQLMKTLNYFEEVWQN